MVIKEQNAQALTARWVEPHPWKGGAAEARLRESNVPVWAIIGQLGGEDGDVAGVADDYDIPPEAVEAALAYYREHQAVIDDRLAANEPHIADGALLPRP
jgi:uncharacterized protein (DUF433 family)